MRRGTLEMHPPGIKRNRRRGIAWRDHFRRAQDGIGRRPIALVTLVVALCLATLLLFGVGHRAIAGWQSSALLLAERRADQIATLLGVALDRDMKGVQASVLAQISNRQLAFLSPYDIADLFASAFARFPYPESFFVWRRDEPGVRERLHAFNRQERPPAWHHAAPATARYPVVILSDPPALEPLIRSLYAANVSDHFVVQPTTIGGRPYQAVAALFHRSSGERDLIGIVGFTVDMSWVREHYFSGLLRQISDVLDVSDMSLSIVDDRGTLVAATRADPGAAFTRERLFPFAFLDRALLARQPSPQPTAAYWTARVRSNTEDGALHRSWRGLWWLLACAATAAILAVMLIGRTLRMTAELAVMRSEFVSTVTHDLKTPLALIRLVGETLGLRRYTSPETIAQYAKLLSTEASRLTLRIDNLLTYARAIDARPAGYRFEPVDLLDLVQESLRRAEPRLRELGFEVDSNLTDAPSVRADRQALLQVLDNLIDNAIKYSGTSRTLRNYSAARDRFAYVSIQDQGIGIEREDVALVFDKFYRGRNAGGSGSGLGLAIARRVMNEHGGAIHIDAIVDRGTTVTIEMPLMDVA